MQRLGEQLSHGRAQRISPGAEEAVGTDAPHYSLAHTSAVASSPRAPMEACTRAILQRTRHPPE